MRRMDPRRFPHEIFRQRSGPPSRNFYNELVPGPIVSTALRASVQPIELQDVPTEAGQQLSGRLRAFVPDNQVPGETGPALRGAVVDGLADAVEFGGIRYAVDKSEHWRGSHVVAELLRES